jgi:hypothetical protein
MSAAADDDRWGTNQMRQQVRTGEHFRRGNALCQDSLRQSDGRWITATEIAITALHARGLDAGDAELKADFIKRISLDTVAYGSARGGSEGGIWDVG